MTYRKVQEIEVVFAPSGEGTSVRLEHRGWERFGDIARDHRAACDEGWVGVLDLYRAAAPGGA